MLEFFFDIFHGFSNRGGGTHLVDLLHHLLEGSALELVVKIVREDLEADRKYYDGD